MLKIKEVTSDEHLQQLRAEASPNIDYLYILKYCNKMLMVDNGKEIPVCCEFITDKDIEEEILDIINILNKEE